MLRKGKKGLKADALWRIFGLSVRTSAISNIFPGRLMRQYDLLDEFSELREVKVLVTQDNGEKLSMTGVAISKGTPYLEVSFPTEAWPELRSLDQRSQLLVCLETEESILFVYATIALRPREGTLLLEATDFAQQKQKRKAERVPAEGVKLLYWPVDAQGQATGEPKEGWAIDISSTGLLMRIDEVIEPCRPVGLKLILPGTSSEEITCTGQVVRLALKPNSSIEVALHFEGLSRETRVRITEFCYGSNIEPHLE
jgi:hypothetical protein